jgi:hypothetical protein
MLNIFRHSKLGWDFTIPFHRQLSQDEADKLIDLWQENESSRLFDLWKSKSSNKEWSGDEEAKKQELFMGFHGKSRGSRYLFLNSGDAPPSNPPDSELSV